MKIKVLLIYLMQSLFIFADKQVADWQAFVAESCQFEISPACLSMLEVKIKKEDEFSAISLFAYKKGNKIETESKVVHRAIIHCLNMKLKGDPNSGPFIGDSVDFLVYDSNLDRYFLVSREKRIDRLLIVPLVNLGDVLLQSGPGTLIAVECELMAITKKWIE